MREVMGIVVLLLSAFIFARYLLWALSDARRRDKSAVLVVIAVVLFFPFGLVAWLLFRPAKKDWAEHRQIVEQSNQRQRAVGRRQGAI
jgi:drug/metabolite transporter (DMT)-like permease